MLYSNLSVNTAGHMTVAGCDVKELAEKYGTPLMVIDELRIRERCRLYSQTLTRLFPAGSMALFASKALSFKQIYRIMAEEGMGVDVVSSGELYTAQQAGFPMERVHFHGNNKTDEDIRFGVQCRVGFFVCDNLPELEALNEEAARQGITQKVLLRLSPGIDPHTHEKINTGRIDSKFGVAIETGQAEDMAVRVLSMGNIELCGFHCHIGSQIFECDPFCDAVVLMMDFIAQMQHKHGFCTEILNLGGGMGVPYTESDPEVDYARNIEKIYEKLESVCEERNLKMPVVLLEPGRSIVADSGVTVYTVGATKTIPGFKNYVSVDGGMTDNPRYTLYQASYTIVPADKMHAPADLLCTVAGRCCESGDLIQEDVLLPQLSRGDLLAVLTTGAYNYSMASNYNRIPRPMVVMIGKDGVYPAVRRETLSDLLLNDL